MELDPTIAWTFGVAIGLLIAFVVTSIAIHLWEKDIAKKTKENK